MFVGIIGFLWELVKLPFALLLLPFKVLSFIVSVVIYGALLLLVLGLLFVFVL